MKNTKLFMLTTAAEMMSRGIVDSYSIDEYLDKLYPEKKGNDFLKGKWAFDSDGQLVSSDSESVFFTCSANTETQARKKFANYKRNNR